MALGEEVAVFTETNLGTRIVLSVPLDITVVDFKEKLEETHVCCFPSLGEIRVRSVMLKRKSRFYHLAESVPLKFVFRDNQKPWFIHAEARLVDGSQEASISNSIDKTKTTYCFGSDKSIQGVIGLMQGGTKKTKKPRTKSVPKPDSISLASGQASLLGPSTTNLETITRSPLSVPIAAEMKNSKCFNTLRPTRPDRRPVKSVSKTETISKKLTVAANNIRMQGKCHMSSTLPSSIFRARSDRKRSLDDQKITSLAKFLVFKVPDNED